MQKLNRILQSVEIFLGTFFLAVMLVLITVNIIFRYVFNNPITWAQELSNYLFVWMGFLAAAYVLGNSDHINITILHSRLPKNFQYFINLITNILLIIMFLFFLYPSIYALDFLQNAPALKIPGKYIRVIVPISFVLMIWHLVINTSKDINKILLLKKGRSE